jgi:hypothetical protein
LENVANCSHSEVEQDDATADDRLVAAHDRLKVPGRVSLCELSQVFAVVLGDVFGDHRQLSPTDLV